MKGVRARMQMLVSDPDKGKTIQDRFTRSNELLSQFNLSVRHFSRDLISMFTDWKKLPITSVRQTVQNTITKFINEMAGNGEEAFKLILEDGMSSAGINLADKGVSANIVRELYINSPIWEAYANMNKSLVTQTNNIITDMLINTGELDKYGKPKGVNQQELVSRLQNTVGMSERRARTIARTETNVVFNNGRALGYQVMDPNQTFRYTWGGPYDRRTSEACEWIKAQTKDGVTLDQLRDITLEAQRKFFTKLTPRPFSGHPNCRHYIRKLPRRVET